MDLRAALLHPSWATEAQIRDARRLLDARGISVPSIAVWLPEDPEQVEKICRMSVALGCPILGGGCAPGILTKHRGKLLELLERFGLVFGCENHPEKSGEEILQKIGLAHDRIGVALDTGWLGTQGADAVAIIRALAPRLACVQLKDILPPEKGPGPMLKAMGHESCALGDGIVPAVECVAALPAVGYSGADSIEQEPEDHDPRSGAAARGGMGHSSAMLEYGHIIVISGPPAAALVLRAKSGRRPTMRGFSTRARPWLMP